MRNEAEFWDNVDKTSDCWVWQRAKTTSGYGKLSWCGKLVAAHRLSWNLTFGDIPDGINVCHHCDNPPCVNPNHLFLGTQLDNVRDMHSKARAPQNARGHVRRIQTTQKYWNSLSEDERKKRVDRCRRRPLTESDVQEIRKRIEVESTNVLAKEFRVSRATISAVVTKKTWTGPRTHCKNGHELTPENVVRRHDRPNSRECKTCRIAWQHENQAKYWVANQERLAVFGPGDAVAWTSHARNLKKRKVGKVFRVVPPQQEPCGGACDTLRDEFILKYTSHRPRKSKSYLIQVKGTGKKDRLYWPSLTQLQRYDEVGDV